MICPAGFSCQLMCNTWENCPNFSTCERLLLDWRNEELRNSLPFGLQPKPHDFLESVIGFQSSSQLVDFYSGRSPAVEVALNIYPGAAFQDSVYENQEIVDLFEN